MELSNTVFEHILALPDRAATFAISRRLGMMFPGQVVRTVVSSEFNLGNFLRYSGLEAVIEPRLWDERLIFKGEGVIENRLKTGIVGLRWRDAMLHVVSYPVVDCHGYNHHVVGPSERLIEDFVAAVLHSQEVATGDVLRFTRGFWERDEVLIRQLESASFDDLVVSAGRLRELKRHVLGFFESEAAYDRAKVAWRRGLLLTGPPGNGKTTAIRALCGAARVPRLLVSDFKGVYGCAGAGVAAVFTKAAECAPCLLIIEDIDSTIRPQFLSSVLNYLDGIKPMRGVMVLATTNYPEKLDPAIRSRPSRFDRILEFPAPNRALRRRYMRRELENLGAWGEMDDAGLDALAAATAGFSFAFLKELTVSAIMLGVDSRAKSTLQDRLTLVAKSLRAQMSAATPPPPADEDEDDDD